MMFELYKNRDFSANFSDTTIFFKTFGKHYFKNYLIINGAFMAVLVVLLYFFSKVYVELISSGMNNDGNDPNFIFDYFNNNVGLMIGGFVGAVLLIVILSMINISYPVIYLSLLEKNKVCDFSVNEITNKLKVNIRKMFVFILGSVFVLMPILIIVFGLLFLLCFILIGVPLLFIMIFATISWIYLSYYEYLLKDVGFFKALINGFKMLKQKLWQTIFTTFLLLLLVQIVQLFITTIPYAVTMLWMFISTQNMQEVGSQTETSSTMGIVVAAIMVLSVLIGFFANNIVMINQGLIYYSLQDDNNNISTINEIDLIGSDIE